MILCSLCCIKCMDRMFLSQGDEMNVVFFLGLAGSVVCDFGFTSECRGSHETWSSVLN